LANVLNGNTWYVDTAHASASDDLALKDVRVSYVVVTATGANAVVVLGDPDTNDTKLDLRVATSGSCEVFEFDSLPIRFPNGVKVKTLTNAVATLVGVQSKGS
jgi:hypothetical protein